MAKFRCSPSVWVFGDKIEKAWGIKKWEGFRDPDKDVIFFGMYEVEDYQVFNNFDGKRTIFWCGGDIPRIFQNPERMRIVKDPNIEHWVETNAQAEELATAGIKANIAPSFLEDIDDFPLSFKPSKNPQIWMSGHTNREGEYGFTMVRNIAPKLPNITFHLYGVDSSDDKKTCPPNVIYHGWVLNKQLNDDIKDYQGSIRANKHDGASEIPFKAMLMGQYSITYLPYEYSWQYKTEEELIELLQRLSQTKEPNVVGRNYWRNNLNKYPWIKR